MLWSSFFVALLLTDYIKKVRKERTFLLYFNIFCKFTTSFQQYPGIFYASNQSYDLLARKESKPCPLSPEVLSQFHTLTHSLSWTNSHEHPDDGNHPVYENPLVQLHLHPQFQYEEYFCAVPHPVSYQNQAVHRKRHIPIRL